MSWKADVFQDIIVLSDLSGLKRFPADKPYNIPHLSGLKRFLTDNLFNLSHLSVKRAYFTDKFGLGDYLNNLPPSAVAYQRTDIARDVIIDKFFDGRLHPESPVER